ncbi:glycosyltransferase family 2 protein [Psychrobium sp. MM17-31]|uniref:glycosyltransferase family 2 protein n=1 Tax=Psychrobium sp. MM17-31 TaxID=2917758 RepID=UPI001EF4ED88|nr:glycosyltransferase family 2 protein [Psychrobium sp. MM17-31]MCG7531329.1 glycosyltransferase family 2 protein [Psychrobium sp. MM17-31]
MYKGQSVVAIIPALNEELAIKKVVSQLLALRANEQQVIDEVIVCDNGSTDSTAQVAAEAGAVVVRQDIPGYGIACLTAMERLPNCDIVLFVDGDDSCFAEQALPMLEGIVNGDDLAIGSRNLGHIEKGALTSTQMFGNWLSSHLITLFWGQKITDLGPFRAMRRDSLMAIDMQDKTFGWTVEMQVKAIICGMQVSEYSVDSKVRIGESKISGTLSGSVKAGIGILSMIAKLYLKKRRIVKHYLRYGQ